MTAAFQPRADADLVAVLEAAFGNRGVRSVTRRPYRYATSATLEEARLELDDGGHVELILKDLSWDGLLDGARRSKPAFLHQPDREMNTYLRLLRAERIGPTCHGVAAEQEHRWLVLEKIAGVELWQVGDVAVWEAVARWLAAFHARFAGRVDEVRDRNPAVLEWGPVWFGTWRDRAVAALGASHDERSPRLVRALGRYDRVIDGLTAMPQTFLHGEFYPSNVLVVGKAGPVRVYPVDWEMAGIGPAAMDLAALVSGWDASAAERIVASYGPVAPVDLHRCWLHLALQWLGWSSEWSAPSEHARDWVGVALAAAEALEL